MMNLVDIANALGRSTYFGGLSESHRRALAGAAALRTLRKNEALFHEGQRGTSVCLLAAGRLQLLKTSPDGKEIVIRTVEPDEVFAEVVLFEQEAYPVTAVAVERSTVVLLPCRAIRDFLAQTDFRDEFVGHLMRRMRYLADRILTLSTYDVEERFFRFLAEQYGQRQEYHITLSKKHLAAAIGTTPETLSRLKDRLASRGLLQWSGRTIRLKEAFWSSNGSNIQHGPSNVDR